MMIVGAPSYLDKRGAPCRPSDLASHDCIVGRRQENRIDWLVKTLDGTTVRQAVPIKHEFQDFESVLMAVRAGHGLTQLPSWMVQDDIRSGALRIVLDGMSGGELPINLLWPRTKTLPAKMRVVIDGLTQWAQDQSAAAG